VNFKFVAGDSSELEGCWQSYEKDDNVDATPQLVKQHLVVVDGSVTDEVELDVIDDVVYGLNFV
jgi:hypothetical protein